MKFKNKSLFLFFLLVICCACQSNREQTILDLRKTGFNDKWLFTKDSIHNIAQTENVEWWSVKIPHDWSIEGKIEKDNPSGRFGGYFPGGIGYYKKSFDFNPKWKGRLVQVVFDGVMANSDVWINGTHLGHRPNGYVNLMYDLTPYLKAKGNEIVVKADNSDQPNSRWYTGCGIYRNVWLTVKNMVSVAENGVFVNASDIGQESAKLAISATIQNATSNNASLHIINEIYNPEGELKKTIDDFKTISAGNTKTIDLQAKINTPDLWSIETPQLYTLVTSIMQGNELLDAYETTFGVRKIAFEVETGFWLNDKNIKVKGVNNHHDGGPVGAAVPNDVLHRRLGLLKEMGCNAIRTAHNPASPEFYNMCDTMGFLVMDEVFDEWIASWPWVKVKNEGKVKHGYHEHFEKWATKDLEDIIIRDRNHPSVFMWSVGNEIPDQCYPEGPKRLRRLLDIAHNIDDSRPVTCGCCFIHLANETGFASLLDVTGYNGGGGSVFYEKDKKTYPNRKFIATEVPHSFQTRGVYKTHTVTRSPDQGFPVENLTEHEIFPEFDQFYSSSYDNEMVRINARDSWRRTDSLDYFAGEFRWTGFDYLGEAIKGWPSRFYNFGIIDLCGFPKDHYYFYQSKWTSDPMVHVLPHWNWTGKEGTTIPVWTYSNADEVELFYNGKSLGKKSNKDAMNLSWDVVYEAGELKAIATSNGKVVAEDVIKTASDPYKLELILDRKTVQSDGQSCVHVVCNVLDKNGNMVPNANNLVTFNIDGPAINLGVENGDPLDLSSTKQNERKVFMGKCLMIVQSTENPGEIQINASSLGLKSSSVSIHSTQTIKGSLLAEK